MDTDLWHHRPDIDHIELTSDLDSLSLAIARFDAIDPILSGNKYYKLYLALQQYDPLAHEYVQSYGGMHSNHLHALSYLAHLRDIPTRLYIRGWQRQSTHTIRDMMMWGSDLRSISRSELRTIRYTEQLSEGALIIPEGGDSPLGILGAAEMYDRAGADAYPNILVPIGSGTTMQGLASRLRPHQRLIGILAFKTDISKFRARLGHHLPPNAEIFHYAHHGHFGVMDQELYDFWVNFEKKYHIPIDPIYGARVMHALTTSTELRARLLPGKSLYIHTGGLQGARTYKSQFY